MLNAQITTNDPCYSLYNQINENTLEKVKKVILPSKSISVALQEDEIDDRNGRPPRFGLKTDVEFNTENSGVWSNLPNGEKLWRLRIKSPGAKSINLIYDAFHLPSKGTLHIYNKRKTHIIGAFTEKNNKGNFEKPGKFATGLIYGDEITLEYHHPSNEKKDAIIAIKGVIHGYKHIKIIDKFAKEENEEVGFGDSGTSCQVNINCSEGNNWQDEKKGVAMLLVNSGTRWCTGSLVNNTNQDQTPYFLTADHCLDLDFLDANGNTDASQWLFYWNYESPNCSNGATEPPIYSTAGATLRANRQDTDFALFELMEDPMSTELDVYINGWDRDTTPTQGGVGIHHPALDIKKIATHNMTPGNGIRWGGGTHWRVNWIATTNGHSVTEGGSSGSPLFMNNGRIIGQLHGGLKLDCSDPSNDPGEYGRFDVSWNGVSATRRLRDWLDPTNTDVIGLDGVYGTKIIGPDNVCASSDRVYSLQNGGTSVTWQASSNLQILSSNNSSITVKAIGNGEGFIEAVLPIGTMRKEVWVGNPEDLSFDGIQGSSNISLNTVEQYQIPFEKVSSQYYTNYYWSVFPTDKLQIVSSHNYQRDVFIKGINEGFAQVRFHAINPCGSTTSTYFVHVRSSNTYSNYTVYPNPSSDNLFLRSTINENPSQSELVTNYHSIGEPRYELFSFIGGLVKRSKINNGAATIEVSDLKKGRYILKIYGTKEEETHHIIVE